MSAIPMPRLPRAACIGAEPSEALCAGCWERPDCLAWALEEEKDGFWGGYSASGRAILRREFGIPVPGPR